ncbi:MAG: ammonia-forming cytochrome c nitrite reductase subunit c552 [Acidobacteria bacterium]|nr:ammonia-forming cytochrome c nitrite reductase subunit c552 [Acidobacteriota bacterium]
MMLLSRHVRKRQFAVGIGGLAATAVAAGLGVTMSQNAVPPESRVAGRPVQIQGAGFVSSQTCRPCHPSEYASWHGSYHRTMTQVATPDSVATSFDNVRVDEVPGEPMRLQVRGPELWAEFNDPDGAGSPRIQRRVVMTTGSHTQQIYWYATGRSRMLGQLPAIWLVEERRWVPRGAAVMRPSGPPHSETGAWNGICVACHTTDGRPQIDTPFGSRPVTTQSASTTSAEFGIACEACHGPGAEHVGANSLPQRYRLHLTGQADPTIVRPDRLDPKRSSQVCGQCHSFWEFPDAPSERRANVQGLPYRPGDELAATRFIVQPTTNLESDTMKMLLADDPRFVRDTFWSDGMVRATGREYNGLIDSPCFTKATDDNRTLSCFSCHAMHRARDDVRSVESWADDQLASGAQGNGACLQCHARQDVSAHTHHRVGSAGSSCYNCHMPYTTYGLLKTIRSHQISSPSVRVTIETGRPNACNLCHLDKTLAWAAETMNRWYATPVPALTGDDSVVAAALLTLLKGDAGQRAIVAQSLGWRPAQEASGTAWMAPFLALLLDDPYDAVRFIAGRSLDTLPGFDSFRFDFVAPPQRRAAQRVRALEIWRDTRTRAGRAAPALLFNPDGTFNAAVIDRLRRERDNRRVTYRE